MDDLVAWLTQIWDEREKVTRAATEGPWKWQAVAPPHKYALVGGNGRLVVPSRAPDVWPSVYDATFMEANDPASVLARIAADRQILAVLSGYCWGDVAPAPCGRCDRIGCRTLRLLAQPYADRPGFRDEWRVAT